MVDRYNIYNIKSLFLKRKYFLSAREIYRKCENVL